MECIFHSCRDGKLKIRALADPMSGESSSGLQTVSLSWYFGMAENTEAASSGTLTRA